MNRYDAHETYDYDRDKSEMYTMEIAGVNIDERKIRMKMSGR